jgi:hypothetical protein
MLFGGAVPPNGFMVQSKNGTVFVNDNGPATNNLTTGEYTGFVVAPSASPGVLLPRRDISQWDLSVTCPGDVGGIYVVARDGSGAKKAVPKNSVWEPSSGIFCKARNPARARSPPAGRPGQVPKGISDLKSLFLSGAEGWSRSAITAGSANRPREGGPGGNVLIPAPCPNLLAGLPDRRGR